MLMPASAPHDRVGECDERGLDTECQALASVVVREGASSLVFVLELEAEGVSDNGVDGPLEQAAWLTAENAVANRRQRA